MSNFAVKRLDFTIGRWLGFKVRRQISQCNEEISKVRCEMLIECYFEHFTMRPHCAMPLRNGSVFGESCIFYVIFVKNFGIFIFFS